MNTDNREELRYSYRPQPIKVLFIGESPPQNGTFFYQEDSNLYRSTREAFEKAYFKSWGEPTDFLTLFQEIGCYLEDLSTEPINGLERKLRRAKRKESIPKLAKRIANMAPYAVIIPGKSIGKDVRKAVATADLQSKKEWCLHFPAQGWQRKYVQGLIAVISELRRDGILP